MTQEFTKGVQEGNKMLGYQILSLLAGFCLGGIIGYAKYTPFRGKGNDLAVALLICFIFSFSVAGFIMGMLVNQ